MPQAAQGTQVCLQNLQSFIHVQAMQVHLDRVHKTFCLCHLQRGPVHSEELADQCQRQVRRNVPSSG